MLREAFYDAFLNVVLDEDRTGFLQGLALHIENSSLFGDRALGKSRSPKVDWHICGEVRCCDRNLVFDSQTEPQEVT